MEGGSPDRVSVESGAKKSSISSGGRIQDRKEFLHKFVDSESLTENLRTWYEETAENSTCNEPSFDVPFELIDLQKFDYALGGVPFQQLIRMPSAIYASTSGAAEATAYLALEDFLHASVTGLWEAFWGEDETLPFYVSSVYNSNLRFYQAEKAIAKGRLGGLCATAVMLKNPRHPQGKWDDILELAILRPDIGNFSTVEKDCKPSLSILGEALFFALRVLLARSLSRSNIPLSLNSVFVLLVDTQYGGVLKVEGDISKLEMDLNDVYGCAAEWIKNNALITISPIDRIWNKLGNANWGDIGALQALYATFHSITQYAGMSKNSVEDLAADHSARLQARRIERQLGDSKANGNGLFRFQQRSASPEIVEVHEEESFRLEPDKSMKLEVGSIVLIEDSNWQKGYQINEVLTDGEIPYYIASSVEDPGTTLFLYVGSHPSQLEPAWEDMKLWYQVQRQTKVLGVMKQKGLWSKYLPQLNASGRINHPGQCRRPSSGGNCDRPWCGTPVLVTSPVGRTVADMVRLGQFGTDEAIKCCHDCLSALSAASSAGIRHGDIRPENVIYVNSGVRQPYFVLIGWGHAILEERDRPAMNLHFSSTYALQEGKLCSASDAESLVYMLYFCSGGEMPNLDSVEGALQWRETSWSKRLIQQNLGDISAVLKAFTDYVDSLCGTPYPMNYDIWLTRLKRHIPEEDHGKQIDTSS
ncbi:uncharacterized protein [Nicotiana tomentosiformis]|uniref:uncharacterized protein n=1 Tax=Nicotiana tomentosiformis TaxID=4098 RepID=UPI00051ACD3A|nr:uncharacterized protein LOC104120208 [Nicotiana tomentosiformis]